MLLALVLTRLLQRWVFAELNYHDYLTYLLFLGKDVSQSASSQRKRRVKAGTAHCVTSNTNSPLLVVMSC